jgi:hypothetical protein
MMHDQKKTSKDSYFVIGQRKTTADVNLVACGRILWMHANFQRTVRAFKCKKNKVSLYMCTDGHEDGVMN